ESLLLIQFIQIVQDRLGYKVYLVQMLEELQTLDALASFLDRELPTDAIPMTPVDPIPVTPAHVIPTPAAGLDAEPSPSCENVVAGQPSVSEVTTVAAALALTKPSTDPPPPD